MKYKYRNYSFEDFLEDEFFRKSVYDPDEETKAFWKELSDKGLIDREAYEQAKELLLELEQSKEIPERIRQRLPGLWSRIEASNQQEKSWKHLSSKPLWRVAAAVALLIISGISSLYLMNRNGQALPDSYAQTGIQEVRKAELSNEIQLIGNHDPITIAGDSALLDYSRRDSLIINNKIVEKTPENAQYNQLVVPFGKRSSITLADGTRVWVNSGSRIIYPVKFDQKFREIYVDGEIYADIAPDKNKPFILKTREMDVRVLGTELNITAYETDTMRQVILVKGSVEVLDRNAKEAGRQLVPNQRFYANQETAYVQEVDVRQYISWKDGLYLFKDERLSSILQKISRYYGVKIVFDPSLPDVVCSGGLDLKENAETVIAGICQATPVEYQREGDSYSFQVKP